MKSALLLHGAGGGAWEWNVWKGVLHAHGIHAQALELRQAPAGLEATEWNDYLDQARAALCALPRSRVAIGASLGGLLAAALADAADALVLINPIPPAPFHEALPQRDWPQRIPWRRDARLESTRRAMPDADDAAAVYAYRRWRDESGAVLRKATAGIVAARPRCPVLCFASACDEDIPSRSVAALAAAWGADLIFLPDAGHISPLLGRDAAAVAHRAQAWWSGRS